MKKLGAVAVIGGGITGIQAGLDLAESGFKVYLIERSPSIGGRMAQLDKTFPTGDCAMCTIAPKIVELTRHPNVEVLTYSEVQSISGKAGNFAVKVKKNPRYVLEDKCNGCGICADVCPIKVPNEFDMGLGARKAIYIPFPQAVPLVYTLDRKNCIQCGKCKISCEIDAIDYDMTAEELEINVGAIIVATGYDLFDPSSLGEYGFGAYKDVITNLQFERLLSPSGPTVGHVIRPSDGREVKRIAFIQCVGSRDIKHYPYCSQICCMASTKEAIVAREHIPDLKSYILYMDMRAFGKGFQEYVNRAEEEYGVEYLRGRAAHVVENDKGDLIVNYEDTESGKYMELEADLVVLTPALKPASGAEELAKSLKIETDEYSFFKSTSEERPLETAREGIFIAGVCQNPRDIPDSVAQASGAASKAEVFLNEGRYSLVEQIEELPEKKISEEPRIGLFVCHCGFNIAGVVDVVDVANYAKSLPNVVYAEDSLYTCSADALSKIKNAVEEHNLNRVVVASCTPRTHEFLFRKTLTEEGLNPYLFEMANIREQCSWAHSHEPEKATEKAKDLVRMAVAKANLLEPLKREKITITPSALVIGGGIAGMTAALDMADQGINVAIVERGAELGGSVNDLNSVFLDAKDSEEVFAPLKRAVLDHPNIMTYLNSKVTDIQGFIGNFDVTLKHKSKNKAFQAGAIILATGSEELKPHGKYMYGEDPRVMTQLELEKKLKEDELDYKRIVMIQCVGARDETYPACSRSCCLEAVKNAIILKKKRPDAQIFILYRDMMTFGKFEDYYRRSQTDHGIRYLRYIPQKPPALTKEDGDLYVQVYDTLLGDSVKIKADLVILTTPQIPSKGVEELQEITKVPFSPDGFFMEAHAKIRPLEFTSDGIYLCGACQSPKELPLTISQASGAASRASSMLSKGTMDSEALTAEVDPDKCIGCGLCARLCPYGAPSVEEGKAKILRVLCKGCGLCAAGCPAMAITICHFTDEQIFAQMKAMLT